MKDYKTLIESDKSAVEIFEQISEKTAAGNIPREGDQLRILEPQGGFKRGDVVKVLTMDGTPDSFTLGVEGGTLSFNREDIDKKFQMVYDS